MHLMDVLTIVHGGDEYCYNIEAVIHVIDVIAMVMDIVIRLKL